MTADQTRPTASAAQPQPPRSHEPLRPPLWVGVVAAVVYVAGAAGLENLLTDTIATRSEAADFALGHYPVLVPLVIVAIVLVRRRGWSAAVWRTPAPWDPAPTTDVSGAAAPADEPGPATPVGARRRRRRWWLLAFPVLLGAQVVLLLALTPWSTRGATLIVVVLLGTLLVGVGEELYFRGILRASLEGRHGQTVTLLVTSLGFGLAHSVGSLIGGLGVGFIAFQVVVTAAAGAVLYGVLRATGRLWVAMLLHGLNDAGLYLNSGQTDNPSAAGLSANSGNIALQAALWILAAVLLISCLRQDHQTRQQRHVLSAESTPEAGQTSSGPPV